MGKLKIVDSEIPQFTSQGIVPWGAGGTEPDGTEPEVTYDTYTEWYLATYPEVDFMFHPEPTLDQDHAPHPEFILGVAEDNTILAPGDELQYAYRNTYYPQVYADAQIAQETFWEQADFESEYDAQVQSGTLDFTVVLFVSIKNSGSADPVEAQSSMQMYLSNSMPGMGYWESIHSGATKELQLVAYFGELLASEILKTDVTGDYYVAVYHFSSVDSAGDSNPLIHDITVSAIFNDQKMAPVTETEQNTGYYYTEADNSPDQHPAVFSAGASVEAEDGAVVALGEARIPDKVPCAVHWQFEQLDYATVRAMEEKFAEYNGYTLRESSGWIEPDLLPYAIPLVNPSAETGDLTGWTETENYWQATSVFKPTFRSVDENYNGYNGAGRLEQIYMFNSTELDIIADNPTADFRLLWDFNAGIEVPGPDEWCQINIKLLDASQNVLVTMSGKRIYANAQSQYTWHNDNEDIYPILDSVQGIAVEIHAVTDSTAGDWRVTNLRLSIEEIN